LFGININDFLERQQQARSMFILCFFPINEAKTVNNPLQKKTYNSNAPGTMRGI
jgi:hypothetical protein